MNYQIGIIGLGYVGLPLAVELSKTFNVNGFDKNSNRIEDLQAYQDKTNEITKQELKIALEKGLKLSVDKNDLADCNVYIVTVPTPITIEKVPDLSPLESACEIIGSLIKKDDKIFFESTVYPGCTEEFCVPIIERNSSLKFNRDFEVGYSPERINPGDKKHTLRTIKKVISGSTENCLRVAKEIYGSVVDAGIFEAASIKVAEAAKVIENTQRDVNIAFMNELNVIFKKLDLNIYEVLEAAQTKWNFLPFFPGLVGGHCIGVDPYYLSFKAQSVGHNPEIILSGRRINDNASRFYAKCIMEEAVKNLEIDLNKNNIVIFGGTFKENCPDFRNTKVVDLYAELRQIVRGEIIIFDPFIDPNNFEIHYPNIKFTNELPVNADIAILAVKHDIFLNEKVISFLKNSKMIFDIKNFLPKDLNAAIL